MRTSATKVFVGENTNKGEDFGDNFEEGNIDYVLGKFLNKVILEFNIEQNTTLQRNL